MDLPTVASHNEVGAPALGLLDEGARGAAMQDAASGAALRGSQPGRDPGEVQVNALLQVALALLGVAPVDRQIANPDVVSGASITVATVSSVPGARRRCATRSQAACAAADPS